MSCRLTMAAACTCPLSPWDLVTSASICTLDAQICRARTEASSGADFFLTVNAALNHKSTDSWEDRACLGCHLGQGLSVELNSCSFNYIAGGAIGPQFWMNNLTYTTRLSTQCIVRHLGHNKCHCSNLMSSGNMWTTSCVYRVCTCCACLCNHIYAEYSYNFEMMKYLSYSITILECDL